MAVTVVQDDEVVLAKGYGIADMDTGSAVKATTRFYIASSTKAFTAFAIAAMAERQEINLDDSLSDIGNINTPFTQVNPSTRTYLRFSANQ